MSDEVLAWLSVWSEVQMNCVWSSWCFCHPIISWFIKIQNGLPFWCQFIQFVLGKRLLNGCSSCGNNKIMLLVLEVYIITFVVFSCGILEASHDFVVCGNVTVEVSMLSCKILFICLLVLPTGLIFSIILLYWGKVTKDADWAVIISFYHRLFAFSTLFKLSKVNISGFKDRST